MKGYPLRFVAVLAATLAATWASGLLLAPTTLSLRLGIELPWRLAASARLGVVALHVAAALAWLFLCGALWSVHMRVGWRTRRQRASGGTMVAVQALLAVTAVAILYAGSERLADTAALLHLAAGVAMAAPLAWHWARGRSRQRAGDDGRAVAGPARSGTAS